VCGKEALLGKPAVAHICGDWSAGSAQEKDRHSHDAPDAHGVATCPRSPPVSRATGRWRGESYGAGKIYRAAV